MKNCTICNKPPCEVTPPCQWCVQKASSLALDWCHGHEEAPAPLLIEAPIVLKAENGMTPARFWAECKRRDDVAAEKNLEIARLTADLTEFGRQIAVDAVKLRKEMERGWKLDEENQRLRAESRNLNSTLARLRSLCDEFGPALPGAPLLVDEIEAIMRRFKAKEVA